MDDFDSSDVTIDRDDLGAECVEKEVRNWGDRICPDALWNHASPQVRGEL